MIDGARLLLSEDYEDASDEEVREAFENALESMETDDARIARMIAGAVGALAPVIGGIVGGQAGQHISRYGQLAGTLGNLGIDIYGSLQRPSGGTRRPTPTGRRAQAPRRGARLPAGRHPQRVASRPVSPAAPAGAPNAAARMYAILNSPQLLQAIGAASMGPSGRSTIQMGPGGAQAPVEAVLGMVAQLAERAAVEHSLGRTETGESDYLVDAAGEVAVADASDPAERADAILELMMMANGTPEAEFDIDEWTTAGFSGDAILEADVFETDFFEADEFAEW